MKKIIKRVKKFHRKHPIKMFALIAIIFVASILIFFFGVSPASILKDSLNYILFALITGTILSGVVHKIMAKN